MLSSKKSVDGSNPITFQHVLLIDKSSSMEPFRKEVIEGVNSNIELFKESQSQREIYKVSIILFSDRPELVIDQADPNVIETIDYVPSGMTALYDAIGKGMEGLSNVEYAKQRHQLDIRVIFTIFTDGQENRSTNYSKEAIRELIEYRKKQGWLFTYIGTEGLDKEAQSIGIKSTLTYSPTPGGVKRAMSTLRTAHNNHIKEVRKGIEPQEVRYEHFDATPRSPN
jgi:Mg-chelatase subunit ChlD